MARFYGATLSVLRQRADKAAGNPEVLQDLLRQVKSAVGNPTVDSEQARRTHLYIKRIYDRCQSAPNRATAPIQPSTQSG